MCDKKIDLLKLDFFCRAEGVVGFRKETNFHAKAAMIQEITKLKRGMRIKCYFDLSRDELCNDGHIRSRNEGQVSIHAYLVVREGELFAKVGNNHIPASPDGDLFDHCGFVENEGHKHVAFTSHWLNCEDE